MNSDTIHAYDMDSTCSDQTGQPTRQLVIDLDPLGIIGQIMTFGLPFTVSEKGKITENKALSTQYLNFMANIDLTETANLKAVGFGTLGKARAVVRAHFEALAGITRQTRRSDGKPTVLIEPTAPDKMQSFIGHLLNPQVCGQSLESVERMNFGRGRAVIDAVGFSNADISKAQSD
jgi:hypothetical protein